MGGLDVFWSEVDPTVKIAERHWRDGEAWTTPVRLGFPINTLADDFSFAPYNDEAAFVCSNRSGWDQLYRLETIEDPIVINITATDYATGIALPGIPLRWIDTRDGSAFELRTNLEGTASVELPHNRAYRVEASAPGYIIEKKVITTTDVAEPWNIKFARIRHLNDANYASRYMGGSPFELASIEWQEKTPDLSRRGQIELTELADFLKLNPDIFMEIRTHEDAAAWNLNDEPSNRLSKNRGIECETSLLRMGVSSKQLLSIGKGVSELTNDCEPGAPCAYYCHEENERTEFRIYGLLLQVPGQIDPTQFSKN
jgi:outer membrane protein OmpA-like peptidoglycan-associated protein